MGRNITGYRGRCLLQALIILLVVSCDQFLKYLVRTNIAFGQTIPEEGGFIRLLYTLNDGVAFSMLQGTGAVLVVIQSVMVLLISIALVYLNLKKVPGAPLYCLSLMLGGGVGNLIDRLSAGKVTDFLAVGDFPVFNLADSALTVGCLIMILWLILSEISSARRAAAASADEEVVSGPEPGLPAEDRQDPEEEKETAAEGL